MASVTLALAMLAGCGVKAIGEAQEPHRFLLPSLARILSLLRPSSRRKGDPAPVCERALTEPDLS